MLELLAVTAVISILAALLLPGMARAQEQAAEETRTPLRHPDEVGSPVLVLISDTANYDDGFLRVSRALYEYDSEDDEVVEDVADVTQQINEFKRSLTTRKGYVAIIAHANPSKGVKVGTEYIIDNGTGSYSNLRSALTTLYPDLKPNQGIKSLYFFSCAVAKYHGETCSSLAEVTNVLAWDVNVSVENPKVRGSHWLAENDGRLWSYSKGRSRRDITKYVVLPIPGEEEGIAQGQ